MTVKKIHFLHLKLLFPHQKNISFAVRSVAFLGSRNQISSINLEPEVTFCPYCKGERPSHLYNLLTELPKIPNWWDYKRNSHMPEEYLPSTHKKVYLKCPDCHYAFPEPVRITYRRGIFRCPAAVTENNKK